MPCSSVVVESSSPRSRSSSKVLMMMEKVSAETTLCSGGVLRMSLSSASAARFFTTGRAEPLDCEEQPTWRHGLTQVSAQFKHQGAPGENILRDPRE
eukprot:1158578-Pelagomonas_calceolata.AAC.5